jgi:hypothetical protein
MVARGGVATVARMLALARNRLLSAADTWERHLVVARLVGRPRTLVDVGGLPGQLAAFLPGTAVTAVNVEPPADLLVDPGPLPFTDASIPAVASLDTLEHVPPGERAGFVAELVRVARDRLVLCCPLGTPQHVAAERALHDWLRAATGAEHPWLAEHLAHGLPTREELEDLLAPARAAGARVRLLFHGDFRRAERELRRIVRARARPRPASLAAFALPRLAHRPDLRLAEAPTELTNRVFAVVEPPGR